jgi:L-ascorbate metabolism protein UlaG (beta-lactamase superfamily)
MQLEWYGQSAFRLTDGSVTVFIDPFDDMSGLAERGMQWDYPAIEGVAPELLLVTHEHLDHNGVGAIDGDPATLRSTAGALESPLGEVTAVASEHDRVAGTERGANVMFAFELGGRRVAHLGDLGQAALRPEQVAALGDVDVLFVPVGGGPTMGAEEATEVVSTLAPSVVVPMHYRTERIAFLEPVDAFADAAARTERTPSPVVELDELPGGEGPLVVVPAAP